MTMLRLHGCPVGCPWCDTKETWHLVDKDRRPSLKEVLGTNPLWCEVPPDEIASAVEQLNRFRQGRWVLVSGGEPALYNLAPLVKELHLRGYRVAIETSGTHIGHVDAGFDWITVSPKIDMPGGFKLKPAAFEHAGEVKFVVGKQADVEKLEKLIALGFIKENTTICLQPLSLNPSATKLCEETAQRNGWRLSVQVHKLLALR
jgi:7-carboxy-7-deazaguanine synthase